MSKISIIIISYNRPNDTLDLLRDISQLNNIDLLQDVIILNNHSTDDYSSLKDFINKNIYLPFRFIDAPDNLGVSRGRNYAAQFARGDIFFFVDDDVNLNDKETLQKIEACFSSNNTEERKLGVVCFKVLYSSTMQMQVTAFPHKKFYYS